VLVLVGEGVGVSVNDRVRVGVGVALGVGLGLDVAVGEIDGVTVWELVGVYDEDGECVRSASISTCSNILP
jgi:hypothetical protein